MPHALAVRSFSLPTGRHPPSGAHSAVWDSALWGLWWIVPKAKRASTGEEAMHIDLVLKIPASRHFAYELLVPAQDPPPCCNAQGPHCKSCENTATRTKGTPVA